MKIPNSARKRFSIEACLGLGLGGPDNTNDYIYMNLNLHHLFTSSKLLIPSFDLDIKDFRLKPSVRSTVEKHRRRYGDT